MKLLRGRVAVSRGSLYPKACLGHNRTWALHLGIAFSLDDLMAWQIGRAVMAPRLFSQCPWHPYQP